MATAQQLDAISEAQEADPSERLENYLEKCIQYLLGEETIGVYDMYLRACIEAGCNHERIYQHAKKLCRKA